MTAPAQPLYFGQPDQPMFGWLHRAADAAQAGFGLVLCNAFGNEAVSTHRTYRRLAEAAAERGVPALRFDYRGTGDSSGAPQEEGQLQRWISDVHQAVDLLRTHTGVQRIYLFGVRFGGTLATLAAQNRTDIAGLITIAVVSSGRRYVRELRALAASTSIPRRAKIEDGVEVAGFLMSESTQAAIADVDLLGLEALPVADALVLRRDDMPEDSGFLQMLQRLGISTRQDACGGYVDMMLDPHDSIVPRRTIDTIAQWLFERIDASSRESPTHRPDIGITAQMGGVRETATFLDRNQRLFGVVTRPLQLMPSQRALLLLNAGSVHHIGPHRLYVDLARQLAGAEHAIVIRLDLAGLGDSAWNASTDDNTPYPETAVSDVSRAVHFARSTLGATEVHVAGICSGAYHSLKAATAHVQVDSVIVINPLTFYWKPGMKLLQPEHRVTAEVIRYRDSARRAASWLKLLRGEVDVSAAMGVVKRRFLLKATHALHGVARALHLPLREDLARELMDMARQGTKIFFLFASGDPGLEMLQEHGGRTISRLQEQAALEINIIEGADHTFTERWARDLLGQRLTERISPSRG